MHVQRQHLFPPLVVCTVVFFLSVLPALGTMGEQRKLSFYNTHTNEHIEVIYKKGKDYNPQALEK